MYVEIAIETQIYSDLGIYPEQIYLPVWELFQSLDELSSVVSKRRALADASIFNKYA